MATKEELAHFKRCLSDASYCCAKIIQLNQQLELAEHEMTGLARHSIPMTKEQENSPLPLPKYQGGGMSIVERIFECDKIKAEIEYYRKRILECRPIDWLADEERDLLVDVFIFRKNRWEIASELELSRKGLDKRVDAILRSFL